MKKHNRIQVLSALSSYLRILKAYNSENIFANLGISNSHNIRFAITVGTLTSFIAIAIVLAIWHLIGDEVAMRKVFIDVPIIITAIQTIVTFSALTMNNRKIDKMIIRLQDTINQRKCEGFIHLQGFL